MGPGDVVGSYDEWVQGDSKGSATSLTYTAQTLDYCRDAGVQAWLVSSCERPDTRDAGHIRVENRPKSPARPGALGYHWQQWLYFLSLARSARAFRATHVVIDSGTSHWFWWALMALWGTKVYVSFHNTYYTIGRWRPSRVRNIIRRLDGWFFAHACDGALGVSEECLHQFVELGGSAQRCVLYNALFEPPDFQGFEPQVLGDGPRHVLYVGRIEIAKGVFDLLSAFQGLLAQVPHLDAHLHYCGDGTAMSELRDVVASNELLSARVTLHGQLSRSALLDAYRQAHVVVVPTTGDFMEGFPKVCAEAILTQRPQIISDAVPTIAGLREAVLVYPCDRPQDLTQAMATLLTDASLYQAKTAMAAGLGARFFDAQKGLSAALAGIMR